MSLKQLLVTKNLLFWITAVVAVAVDQISKTVVIHYFHLGETIPLWPSVFHLTYVTNTGAAFSIFKGEVWLRWLSLVVSLGLMILGWFGPRLNRWEQAGYGFILGGAIGNGIDRFATGAVIDFLDARIINFPVFNLADVSINIGVVCILIAAFWRPRRPNSPES
ncbi:MAG: signal peptidase II [Cyanobacteria bacterium]|nr:signal peptidase II [Cyanobacteriota bacterium]MDW8201332.1 signal peptidase II [Cyanobacteriota bacterium SKYGB_h_bin112]